MDSDFSRVCTKMQIVHLWFCCYDRREKTDGNQLYVIIIHTSELHLRDANESDEGDVHADDCSRVSSCMIIFIPAHHVFAKAILNTSRGPFNCHLSINMSEFFGRFLCVLCDSLWTDPRSGTLQLFFSPLLPNPQKSSGVAFPDSNVNNKKMEERKKG